MMRLGIFGGTFDPPHVGHLVTAVNVRHELGLDRVLLVVNYQPWQKLGTRSISPAKDRLALVEAAVGNVEGLEASRIEIDRGGVSYTADTLSQLTDDFPGSELFLILGSDAAAKIDTWGRAEEVRKLATLVVVERPRPSGEEREAFVSREADPSEDWSWVRVEAPRLEVSSTDLRARVVDGRPLDYLLTPQVIECIEARGLYRERVVG